MFLKREARHDAKGFSDLIDYFALVGDGIVLLSPGIYLAGWEFTGRDMEALSIDECGQISQRLASKLRLGSGWTVQCDSIRREHQEYCPPTSNWPDPISYLIDQERRARFHLTGEAAPRLSRYFITLSFEPAIYNARQAARWLFTSDEKGEGPGAKALALFEKRIAEFELILGSSIGTLRRLRTKECSVGSGTPLCDELLRLVRQTITTDDYPFAVPDDPSFLNQCLVADDFTGGAEPQLGDPLNDLAPGKRIAVLAIDGFPERSFPGMMRELDALPFDFRYCQQAQLLDEEEAKDHHKANKSKWKFKKKPASHTLSPIKTVEANVEIDGVAAEMEVDAKRAMSAAEYGREINARFSAKIILMDSSADKLRDAVRAAIRTVTHRCGFGCRIETINAVAAWLASFPGQHYKDRRTFVITTNNLVHMMPMSAPYRGLPYNPSPFFPPRTPPLLYGMTSGGTPYRFHGTVSDVRHQLIAGPTGSGKTTLLGLEIAQFFRYPKAQVFAFDKKKTLYTLCKAMGGDFYDISPNNQSIQMCPLQDLDTQGDRDSAAQQLELLLVANGLAVGASMRNEIKATLYAMSRSHGGRSLTDFYMAVPSEAVKEALRIYLDGILDGERDAISLSRFCVFEMDELYRLDKKTMNGALFHIFSKIQRRLTSSIPTFVSVDEFREALSHPVATKYFDDFLYEGRKLNMGVAVALQDLSLVVQDASGEYASSLGKTVVQQCHTKILLPNPQADADAAQEYVGLRLGPRDREIIANAEPKSEYYVTSTEGKRLVSLELGPLTLAFLAHSNDADRALVDTLIERHGDNWPAQWLQLQGLGDWAQTYRQITANIKKEPDCA